MNVNPMLKSRLRTLSGLILVWLASPLPAQELDARSVDLAKFRRHRLRRRKLSHHVVQVALRCQNQGARTLSQRSRTRDAQRGARLIHCAIGLGLRHVLRHSPFAKQSGEAVVAIACVK